MGARQRGRGRWRPALVRRPALPDRVPGAEPGQPAAGRSAGARRASPCTRSNGAGDDRGSGAHPDLLAPSVPAPVQRGRRRTGSRLEAARSLMADAPAPSFSPRRRLARAPSAMRWPARSRASLRRSGSRSTRRFDDPCSAPTSRAARSACSTTGWTGLRRSSHPDGEIARNLVDPDADIAELDRLRRLPRCPLRSRRHWRRSSSTRTVSSCRSATPSTRCTSGARSAAARPARHRRGRPAEHLPQVLIARGGQPRQPFGPGRPDRSSSPGHRRSLRSERARAPAPRRRRSSRRRPESYADRGPEARGPSREELAAAASVSLSTVWRFESGAYPRVEHLIALADALEVDLDTFVDHPVRGVTTARPRDHHEELQPATSVGRAGLANGDAGLVASPSKAGVSASAPTDRLACRRGRRRGSGSSGRSRPSGRHRRRRGPPRARGRSVRSGPRARGVRRRSRFPT